jgi:hypothetical protein
VDVDGARVVRVNDLKLRVVLEDLCLAAVDVGFRGVLRRLGYLNAWDFMGGVLHRPLARKEIDWLFVQPLGANLSRLTLTVTRDKLSDLHPADLANIISQLPHQKFRYELPTRRAGEALGDGTKDSSHVLSQLEARCRRRAGGVHADRPPTCWPDFPTERPRSCCPHGSGRRRCRSCWSTDNSAGSLMNNEYLSSRPTPWTTP